MSSVLNEAVVHGYDAAYATDRPADIDADIAAALIPNHLASSPPTNISVDGDTDVAQHWLDNTAHVSG